MEWIRAGWRYFWAYTPHVRFSFNGEPLFTGNQRSEPAIDEVRYCYDFVIESALKIQQHDAAVSRLLIG